VRSVDAEQTPQGSSRARSGGALPHAGQSYLERLGVVYMDQVRLTIVTELYMREMGVRQFFGTVGGSSYDSVRRHFLKLIEFGWLRYVRTAKSGRGRPEKLYRSTELAVIDTETWRTLPFSIRDAFTIQLLEEMGGRVGEALREGLADVGGDLVRTFRTVDVDELAWCEAYAAVERCFNTLLRKQTDAKIRLEASDEQPQLIVVNLAAFEAPKQVAAGSDGLPRTLPKAEGTHLSPWPERVGKVFRDRLDLAIVDQLTKEPKTPEQLQETFGGATSGYYLRRCKRLADQGWAVRLDSRTGGAYYGASVPQFRAALPNVSEADIYRKVPPAMRQGRSWGTFKEFTATSIRAVEAGTFNNRTDRHMTMSPLLVDVAGREQVGRTLRSFQEDLARIELDLEKRRRQIKKLASFPAGFLLSAFDAPLRDLRV
jgi:hypothetical protein